MDADFLDHVPQDNNNIRERQVKSTEADRVKEDIANLGFIVTAVIKRKVELRVAQSLSQSLSGPDHNVWGGFCHHNSNGKP